VLQCVVGWIGFCFLLLVLLVFIRRRRRRQVQLSQA
jgi:LPXTG-motif cell wall-anchored protein